MINNGPTTKTKCEHKFHSECIERWLTEKNTCPICRRILVEREQQRRRDDAQELGRVRATESINPPEQQQRRGNAQELGRVRATESINRIRSNYAAALRDLESIDDSRLAVAWRQAALSAGRDAQMTLQILRSQYESAWAAAGRAWSIAVDRGRTERLPWMERDPAVQEAHSAYLMYRDYARNMEDDLQFEIDRMADPQYARHAELLPNLRQDVRERAMRLAVPYLWPPILSFGR